MTRGSLVLALALIAKCLLSVSSFSVLPPFSPLSGSPPSFFHSSSSRLRSSPSPSGVPEVSKVGGRGSNSVAQDAIDKGLTLGAPKARPTGGHYLTKGGVQITASVTPVDFSSSPTKGSGLRIEKLITSLDSRKGVLLSSSYEYPGRYSRWSLGFVDPPLEVSGSKGVCTISALNSRGGVLLPAVHAQLATLLAAGELTSLEHVSPTVIKAVVAKPKAAGTFAEEERSRQASLFSIVRSIVDLFSYKGGDGQLGLYGAFGYDLAFQFEPIKLSSTPRDDEQRDLLLYLPDEVLVVDQDGRDAWTITYDFAVGGKSTAGKPRDGSKEPFKAYAEGQPFAPRDTPRGEFTKSVELAKREFAVGNLFEAVLSQTFREKLNNETPPSTLFRRLRDRNPSPYGFFINLGQKEYLVGASPEMFVRVEETSDSEAIGQRPALRVETCPISGTVARGKDALEDAINIQAILSNEKEKSELTMCTDVDRNDKSRICEPGSVKVIGRRQIEMYSRLIHTVDHVEGYLRPEFDALDAFLCHTWAVTVTGAPKTWAMQFVEDHEKSQRCWYGGAVGLVGFDGSLNTGLTLRTVRVKEGIAEIRAGATLLYDSNPVAEELETELKASAMLDAVTNAQDDVAAAGGKEEEVDGAVRRGSRKLVGVGKNIILIDHEDSFVHTLANYLRQTGANVQTMRSGDATLKAIEEICKSGEKRPDLIVLSPGPGSPSDFGLSKSIDLMTKYKIPGFGVCLGLQGMVEHFGGTLGVLSYPMHGKPSPIFLTASGMSANSIFSKLPNSFEVARYHSLHGIKEKMPSCLDVTALSKDGIVMGIQHKTLPFAAVQFHPESILTSPAHGMQMLENAISFLRY